MLIGLSMHSASSRICFSLATASSWAFLSASSLARTSASFFTCSVMLGTRCPAYSTHESSAMASMVPTASRIISSTMASLSPFARWSKPTWETISRRWSIKDSRLPESWQRYEPIPHNHSVLQEGQGLFAFVCEDMQRLFDKLKTCLY